MSAAGEVKSKGKLETYCLAQPLLPVRENDIGR